MCYNKLNSPREGAITSLLGCLLSNLKYMAYKAIISGLNLPGSTVAFTVGYLDVSNNNIVEVAGFGLAPGTDITDYSEAGIASAIQTRAISYSTSQGYGITSSDFIWAGESIQTQSRSFNFSPGRSVVTGTGATGFQVSTSRDAFVTYSPKIVTTATIAGGQDGYVVFEIASTNSATAGDWKEVGRIENGQALSLALTLQSVQPIGAPLVGIIPASYYGKIRSVNVTGTPVTTYVSGQEVLL